MTLALLDACEQLLTDRRMYRIKFDFDTKSANATKAVELTEVVRIEYGSFKAAKTSLTTWVWKKEIEQQQVRGAAELWSMHTLGSRLETQH